MSNSPDPSTLALPGRTVARAVPSSLPRHAPGERFLKGPIPWSWLSGAAQQPGKALHVGAVLWFMAGMRRSATVTLSGKLLRACGVDRYAGYRGLRALECARLVRVVRHPGRSPEVTVLDVGTPP